MIHDDRGTLPFWTIPCGTLGGLRVRISCLFLAVPILFCVWFGFGTGAILTLILLASVCLHEAGRGLSAKLGGAKWDLCVLWPVGGLSPARREHPATSSLIHFGGLVANLFVCGVLAWPLWSSGHLLDALDVTRQRLGETAELSGTRLAVMIFTINWGLVLFNLLPLVPFDCGYLTESVVQLWSKDHSSKVVVRRTGWLLATLALVVGLAANLLLVSVFAGLAMVSLLFRDVPEPHFESESERFLGYDFSEGYTSLDRTTPHDEAQPLPPQGFIERWRRHREQLRQTREAEFDREVNQKLDQILAKVHETGMESLTPHEQQLLKRASLRYRERGTSLSE